MKVLVTGGAGYIGSVTVEELLKEGHEVIVLDNLRQGHQQAVPEETKFVEGDIGDKDLLSKIFEENHIQAVIHLAAETVVEYSMTDPQRYFVENVSKGLILLEAMLENDVNKMVFSSSAAVYGEPTEVPITEDHEPRPINSYGESKLMFEKILDWYQRAYDLKFISLRYFNAAGATETNGPDQEPKTHLIPLVLERAIREVSSKEYAVGSKGSTEYGVTTSKEYGVTTSKEYRVGSKEDKAKEREEAATLRVFGDDYPTRDGTCVRDYIHVLDLAQAHILALENLDENPNCIFNLGNGEGFTVLEVIDTAKQVTDIDIPYKIAPRRSGDPAVLVASNQKAKKELGWKPRYGLEDIIASAWRWQLAHPEGYEF